MICELILSDPGGSLQLKKIAAKGEINTGLEGERTQAQLCIQVHPSGTKLMETFLFTKCSKKF